jgi:hypothetical protein
MEKSLQYGDLTEDANWTGAEANVVPQKRYGSKSHLGLRVS